MFLNFAFVSHVFFELDINMYKFQLLVAEAISKKHLFLRNYGLSQPTT